MTKNGFNSSEYESFLNSVYDDVPDDWDMYEDMEKLKSMADSGASTEEIFQAEHGIFFGRHVETTYEYDGSEFGD